MVAKNDCVPREQLKEYLAGWSAPSQSDWIESHVSDCLDCEQTIVDLEKDPETLVDYVRQTPPHGRAGEESSDRFLEQALVEAKANLPHSLPTSSASEDWEPEVGQIDSYELLQPLGRGGMGAVYSAKHNKLGKKVAIKLLPTRTFRNEQFAARFQREIRAAGGVNHPAIVSATDAGEYHGTHYLVMELIDGLDVSRLAKLNKRLSVADACAILRQVALGLSHAHAEGIVHRDVKPSNLMLNTEGQTKILDFGLARLGPWDEGSADLTTVGQLMGTLDYMAPEQAENAESVDFRADLYSLGATLFRLLCGRPPLAAAPDLSPLVKLRLLATQSPPDVRTLRDDVPEGLAQLLVTLLSSNPNGRPASAAHVAESLEPFCDGADLVQLISESKLLSEQAGEDVVDVPAAMPAALPKKVERQVGRSPAWWLNACLLAALALAGFFVVLETQKGQLVIESEVETKVSLRQDGQQVRQLQIEPGVNTTRLYSGKYEVELAGGSDRIQISETAIAILRGKTQVATVTLEKDERGALSTPAEQSEALALGAGRSEPVYQGKTIGAWMYVLKTERSKEELSKAYQAIDALASEANGAEVTQVVLNVVPNLDGSQELKTGPDRVSSLDYAMFSLLKKLNDPDAYDQLILTELQTSDVDWQRRVIKRSYFFDPARFEKFLNWFEKEMFFGPNEPANLPTAIEFLTGVYASVEDKDLKSRIERCLRLSPHIDSDTWLRKPAFHSDGAALKFSKASALEAFLAPDTAADLTAQSTAILSALIRQDELDSSERMRLADALVRRLGSITAEEMTELVDTDEFPPEYLAPRPGVRAAASAWSRGNGPGIAVVTSARSLQSANVASLLVELAQVLHQNEVAMTIAPTLENLRELLDQQHGEVLRSFSEAKTFVQLQWPLSSPAKLNSLGARSLSARGSGRTTPPRFDASSVSREEWIALILDQQIRKFLREIQKKEAESKTESASTNAGPKSDQEESNQPRGPNAG